MSYIKTYYENKKIEKLNDFFKDTNANPDIESKITDLKKEVKRLENEREEKNKKLMDLYSNKYVGSYSPIEVYLKYESKSGAKYYYSVSTGSSVIDIPEDSLIMNLCTKAGVIVLLTGYQYETGSAVIRKYKYSINMDNSLIKLTIIGEAVTDIFTGTIVNNPNNKEAIVDYEIWSWQSGVKNISGNTFLKNMFDLDRDVNLTLEEIRKGFTINKSAEIIIREAPTDKIRWMIGQTQTESLPLYKLFNIDKATYNYAKEKGYLEDIIELSEFIKRKDIFNKTDKEWIEAIDKFKKYEEDFAFYNINVQVPSSLTGTYGGASIVLRKNKLLGVLAHFYAGGERYSQNYGANLFSQHYSFGKFSEYVVNEVINQGYSELQLFLIELKDYLRMCKDLNVEPTLFSSYLKQTHDITSRNHKIAINEIEKTKFAEIYNPIKTYKLSKDYQIVKPSTPHDVQKEGDTLNHCVASYIKRILDGETLIMFLRKELNESLITLEVRDNRIVQARGLHNRKPTAEECKAISEYADKAKLSCAY